MLERLGLIEQQLDEREDEAMAMRFSFMALARALDERGVLPLPVLDRYLSGTADSLRIGSDSPAHDLAPVAAQVDSLRAALQQL